MSKLREVKKEVSSIISRGLQKVKGYFKGLQSRDDQSEQHIQTPRTASQIPLLSAEINFVSTSPETEETLVFPDLPVAEPRSFT
ncbi:hypothetical protein F5Y13DRAFT_136415 [Hypoxylon sp. FL1857]|nr:hypothetical protein F5Y13DRAFT_136415 [Hypoxylon sp. FL1857]